MMAQKNINLFKQAWTGVHSITAKITGTNTDAVYVETSDADATAADMLNGKTAYVNASKITGNIATKSSNDLTASGATVTAPAGYYASAASKSVASGTEGTPTATKGSVSNHAISVTPSVTNSAGYISGGTKTGTAVSVSASELVSGSETKTANGTYDVTNLAQLVVNVSGGGGSGLTLLTTKSLGSLSTTSTSQTNTGQTVTVTGYNDYDALIVDISVDTQVAGRHTSTVSVVYLTGTNNVTTKNTFSVGTNRWNSNKKSNGDSATHNSTSGYGVYVYSASESNGTLTLAIYYRYSSTSTTTLNGTYTARVYGLKLFELIGG